MKSNIVFILFLVACTSFSTSGLFGQHKQGELEVGKNYFIYSVTPGGENEFLLVYGEQLLSKKAQKMIMKYNSALEPVWKQPVAFSGMGIGSIDLLSYTDPADKTTCDYVFGSEQFLQILPDGTVKEKNTELPKKEIKNTAAVFTDSKGLNILTLAGDDDFPTGVMSWYTFDHGDLSMKKRTIALPMPADRDKDDESGWRLKKVTDSGLYFYSVSYKNDPKDETRSILSCHIAYVDGGGKVENTLHLDSGLSQYEALPADYRQDLYPGLRVFGPNTWAFKAHPSGYNVYVPTDNSFMGVEIDEQTGRIYTLIARNDALKVAKKDGSPEGDIKGWAYPVKSLELTVYSLTGEQLSRSVLDHTAPKLAGGDDYGYRANEIAIKVLPNGEGVICKLLNNNTGVFWVINPAGEMTQQVKFHPHSYKAYTTQFYKDVFSSDYFSVQDFQNSPYVLQEKSGSCQSFNKLDEKTKRAVHYLSGKNYELLAVMDSKKNVIRLDSFIKT